MFAASVMTIRVHRATVCRSYGVEKIELSGIDRSSDGRLIFNRSCSFHPRFDPEEIRIDASVFRSDEPVWHVAEPIPFVASCIAI